MKSDHTIHDLNKFFVMLSHAFILLIPALKISKHKTGKKISRGLKSKDAHPLGDLPPHQSRLYNFHSVSVGEAPRLGLLGRRAFVPRLALP
jgi:hypothetical protein